MPTFAAPAPLEKRITHALTALRQARQDGDATRIYIAQRRLDTLTDRLPRGRTLTETHPELDKWLRVDWR